MDYRECNDAYNINADYRNVKSIVSEIIKEAGFVSFVGPNCTGKSRMKAYVRKMLELRGCSVTDWDRDSLYNLLIANGDFPQSLHNVVYQFEMQVFEKLYRVYPDHTVLYEGTGIRPRWRPNYGLTFGKKSVCLVFDGPLKSIVDRFEKSDDYYWKDYKSREDFSLDVNSQQLRYQWPTSKEGWDRIYYINTFGEEGENYLAPLLIER